jgi:acrylyl-CoA reductase (NADPH)
LNRTTLAAASKRPLDSERWAAAVDSVGGDTLAAILRSLAQHGSVAACGLAGGAALNTSVFPFILRGVNLLGIDSSKASKALRLEIWSRLARDLPLPLLESLTDIAPLPKVFELGEKILAGQIRGRMVIDVNAIN